MVDVARARRLAVRIREITAETLERDVKDPRLGMVTVTDARVTPDLREATVFYTVFGDEVVRTESAAALESARGVVRAAVGRATGIRYTPTIAFVPDSVPEVAEQLKEVLAVAQERDAAVAAIRVGATYAGEADPYRQPRVDDDLDDDLDDDSDADDDDADDLEDEGDDDADEAR